MLILFRGPCLTDWESSKICSEAPRKNIYTLLLENVKEYFFVPLWRIFSPLCWGDLSGACGEVVCVLRRLSAVIASQGKRPSIRSLFIRILTQTQERNYKQREHQLSAFNCLSTSLPGLIPLLLLTGDITTHTRGLISKENSKNNS